MAYEELGEISIVQLGGINKLTGKKNPSELEGYYLGFETRSNKFNPQVPQKLHKFKSHQGEIGIFGKAGIDKVLKGASIGAMTKLVSTGEVIDTGKGNPMKVFKAFQDKANTLDVASEEPTWTDTSEEEEALEEPVVARPSRPAVAAQTPSSSARAEVQAMLSKRR